MNFETVVVNGIPLVLVIAGLVAFAKTMGLAGKALTALSLSLGIVFGLLSQLSLKTPTSFAEWFGAVVFGLALGVVTSGLYDLVKRDVISATTNTATPPRE